jgi:hypothetical protein
MNDRREDELITKAGRLAQDVAPGRDLWPSIAEAIEQRKRRPWHMSYLAQAAAVLLLVGASSAVTYVMVRDTAAPIASDSGGLIVEPVSYADHHALGPKYEKAHDELEAQLQEELERLPPNTRADVERNLTIIRGAIAEISVALDAEPDNALLQQLLLKSYQEELMLMQHVGGLTQRVMARKDI